MFRWPFIVLIVFAVLFARVQSKPTAQMDNNGITTMYMPRMPFDSGFSATLDGLAAGVSTAGNHIAQAAFQLVDTTFHSLAMLASGTLGLSRVNMGTRNFGNYFGPNSMLGQGQQSVAPTGSAPGTGFPIPNSANPNIRPPSTGGVPSVPGSAAPPAAAAPSAPAAPAAPDAPAP